MGMVCAHKVGTGVHIIGPDIEIDLIVRSISGPSNSKTARIEVKGSSELDEIIISHKDRNVLLEGLLKLVYLQIRVNLVLGYRFTIMLLQTINSFKQIIINFLFF